jgi:hypothetical protein
MHKRVLARSIDPGGRIRRRGGRADHRRALELSAGAYLVVFDPDLVQPSDNDLSWFPTVAEVVQEIRHGKEAESSRPET